VDGGGRQPGRPDPIAEGEWAGVRPTGKPLVFTGVNVDRVVDGRIVEHGGAASLLGPLLEAGAVRVAGTEPPSP
jgi:hypothetical protein